MRNYQWRGGKRVKKKKGYHSRKAGKQTIKELNPTALTLCPFEIY
jgi:hypothetical protein